MIFKDILLIILGAGLAYIFDLFKRLSDVKKEKSDELLKHCNELIFICNKLNYYTKLWIENFYQFHYYQQLHYRSKDTTISTVMLKTHM